MKKKIGQISVDAGLCWIGDPCYIHKDNNETSPREWGTDWSMFCQNLLQKEVPGEPTTAQFSHDQGHTGLGVCVSTGLGDGLYDVYADIEEVDGWGKRVKSVTIVFLGD